MFPASPFICSIIATAEPIICTKKDTALTFSFGTQFKRSDYMNALVNKYFGRYPMQEVPSSDKVCTPLVPLPASCPTRKLADGYPTLFSPLFTHDYEYRL